ncbi:divergent polysaccharide deacetylase family protein [Pseudorhodobacter aquimaris]|uniref:divergent polysaccharide deacetylase family protein n=1 Tax=Pseudorhodobacter aquimaris TaxID=687412 RepID=UPI00067B888A|nr:divergent polysaccharide deacetylase family protein [Pseudorhodobacter aquimaris]
MSRGFFIGAGCGAVVAGLGLIAVSQLTDFLPAPQDLDEMLTTQVAQPAQSTPEVSPNPPPESATVDPRPEPDPQIPDSSTASDLSGPAVESNAPSLPDTQSGTDVPLAPGRDGIVPDLAPDAAALVRNRVEDAAPRPDTPPEPALRPQPEQAEAPVIRPSTGFDGGVAGVKTGRLPSIGDDKPAMAAPEVTPPEENIDLPAVDRFAASFDNPAQKPLFSILLRDTGEPDIDREALARLPFPISFVIDATLPEATKAAQIYRANGKEVLMLATGIPEGATAADLSVSMEVITAALPEAVGVVDLEQGGFQADRSLATQMLALLRDHGLGVISWDRGLNAASQIAQREGMRSAVIFRNLDGENEGAPKIRRYLDRAAFKAAQDGRVVVAGETRPETIAALLEWAQEGRSSMVAIAPSTAVMMAP